MDILESFIHDNLEMIQKIPLDILNVLEHAVKKLSIFIEIEENKEFRHKWLAIFDLIDSERKEILKNQADRELVKASKKMVQQVKTWSLSDDEEAGAPEYRPQSFSANTNAPVSKPLNRRKDNEKNQINGAKTKKKK